MSFPAVGMRPQPQFVEQRQEGIVVNSQPSKEDRLIEQGAEFVVQTLANIFKKEINETMVLLNQGKTLDGNVFEVGCLSGDSVYGTPRYIRADKVVTTYVTDDFQKKLSAMNTSSKEYELLNAVYHKAVDKLYESKNLVVRGCLSTCGDKEKGKEAFMYSDLLRAVCLRGTQEIIKKL